MPLAWGDTRFIGKLETVEVSRMDPINYELLAVKLGDAIKWERSVNEIERIAQATIGLSRKQYQHPNITSVRAQTIYDYIKTLESVRMPEDEKRRRIHQLVTELIPDEGNKVRLELLRMIGVARAVPAGPPNFASLVNDCALEEVLRYRWAEIQKCLDSGAYLAALVMMGSLLEGVLLAVIAMHPKEAYSCKACPKGRDGQPLQSGNWSLHHLIEVAHECGWIERDARDFSQELRDYRNMVHPWHQRMKNFRPDEDTCSICWQVVRAALNDLEKNLAARG